ncbi:MAG: PAS domain S-box protein [Pseudomonadota bacterium]
MGAFSPDSHDAQQHGAESDAQRDGKARRPATVHPLLSDGEAQPDAPAPVMIEVTPEVERLLRLLQVVIENTSVLVVITNAQREIEWVNGAYTRLTGWTIDEIRGRTPASFLHGPATDRAVVQRIDETIARGETVDYAELLNYRKDGTPYWVSVNIQPIRDGDGAITHFVAIEHDITERKRAERRLRSSERRLAEAQRLAQIGNWELDLRSNVLLWSEEVFRIFEIDSRKFKATYEAFLDRIHPDDRDAVNAAYWNSVHNREPYEIEHRLLFSDGRVKWVVERGRTDYNERGAPLRSRGTVQDVTERKAAEAARREKDLAERASLAKSQFLSQMSHELRTPLNAVLGFAQILLADRKEPLTDTQRARVACIQDAGGHLLALINDLLDLSRIEAGGLALSIEPIDVDGVLQEAIALVQARADERGITLRRTVARNALRVAADRTRLRQVLVNLLSNAIKYNREGGSVTVEARATTDGTAAICVIDTGIGIPADRIARLFVPFERLGQEAGPIEGTGIGLALVRAIVERMQGRVTVDSEAGVGSTFCVQLPSAAAVAADGARADAAACDADDGRKVAGTILYVEDNPINVAVLQALLEQRPDVRLLTAANGAAGLALAVAERPDLVLIDMQLPDLDGYAVHAKLRAAPETAAIPCIALSANAFPEHVAQARAAGFLDYWTKPIDAPAVLARIDQLLARRTGGAATP